MEGPWLHPREPDRLESLRSYDILDSAAENAYDGAVELAATVCGTPAARLTFVDVDRQWCKASVGLPDLGPESARAYSICSDVVAVEQPVRVDDLARYDRYRDLPIVVGAPFVRAYLGVPLVGRDGLPLGALSVMDLRPRRFTGADIHSLELIAQHVATELELRRVDRRTGRSHLSLLADAAAPRRLRRALDRGEFVNHYQPARDMRSGQLVSFEALLRWDHPQLGVLPPSLFLPAIESSGLIHPVERHVVDNALALQADLRRRQPGSAIVVAVNVSGAQLQEPGLAEELLRSLERSAGEPENLTIELTETAPLDTSVASQELAVLRSAGVGIALDDYGAGHSTVGQLLELPITTLKLDRSITKGLPGSDQNVKVVQSTIGLAADLGIDIICEGVESEAQRDALTGLGAIYGQGWLFGRPQHAANVLRQE